MLNQAKGQKEWDRIVKDPKNKDENKKREEMGEELYWKMVFEKSADFIKRMRG